MYLLNAFDDWFKLVVTLSLRFNGHFPGEPELGPSRCLLKQRMMEMVVTTGLLELSPISRA